MNPSSSSLSSRIADTHRTTENQGARCKMLLRKLKAIQLQEIEEFGSRQFETILKNLADTKNIALKEAKVPDFLARKGLPIPPPDAWEPEDITTEVKIDAPPPDLETKHGLLELEDAGNMWRTNVRELLLSLGPLGREDEETDSCSDGEDEVESMASWNYGNVEEDELIYLPTERNPATNWAKERLEIISKFAWVRDQIRLVDKRIEQQDKLIEYMRDNKPQFKLDESPRMMKDIFIIGGKGMKYSTIDAYWENDKGVQITSADSSSTTTTTSMSSRSSLSAPARKTENEKENAGDQSASMKLEPMKLKIKESLDPTCVARRCFPVSRPFKQRKIIQLGGIHNVVGALGKDPKEPQTLCSCYGRTELCIVCSGRSDKIKRVRNGAMPRQEVKALLDHNYHKVLSTIEEKPVRLVTEGLMKKFARRKRTDVVDEDEESEQAAEKLLSSPDHLEKKKYRGNETIVCSRRRPAAATDEAMLLLDEQEVSAGAKRRSKKSGGGGQSGQQQPQKGRGRGKGGMSNRARKRKRQSDDEDDEEDEEEEDDDEEEEEIISWSLKKPKSERRQRRTESEKYDIDNIVIPYNVAASTRVEKLEYKEIDTPGFRLSKLEPLPRLEKAPKEKEIEEVEDLSEEFVAAMHARCEQEEKARFMKAMTMFSNRRTRKSESVSKAASSPTANSSEKGMAEDDEKPGPSSACTPIISIPDSPKDNEKEEAIMMIKEERGSTSTSPTTVISAADSTFAVSALKVSSKGVPTSMSPTPTSTFSKRKRTRSIKIEDEEELEEEEEEEVQPWTPRRFPLSEDEYAQMQREQEEWEAECGGFLVPPEEELHDA